MTAPKTAALPSVEEAMAELRDANDAWDDTWLTRSSDYEVREARARRDNAIDAFGAAVRAAALEEAALRCEPEIGERDSEVDGLRAAVARIRDLKSVTP